MTAPFKLSAADLRRVEKTLYEQSFYEFVRAAWQVIDPAPYKDNWHIEVVCDHLQGVVEGVCQNLLINIAPGVGKSLITNVFFPAWIWTTQPEKSFLSVAHGESLAIRDANKMRRLIESDWYRGFWQIRLRKDQNSKANFENDRGGYRLCSPMANSTGKRANYILVDDPHSVKGAGSEAVRNETLDVFRGTLPTRVNDPERDSMIVIMQRLHQEDVSGYILQNQKALKYDHLCIPYVCDGNDREPTSLGWKDHRSEGDLMWPEHFSPQMVEARKVSLGPFGFAGQFMQNPVPATDGFFRADWFKRHKPEERPEHLHYYLTSDHAPSGRGDYNVFRVWGVDEYRNLWLIDSFRKKCTMDEAFGIERAPSGRWQLRTEGALPLIRKYRPLGWFPESDPTWIANKQFVEAAMLDTGVFCAIKTLPVRAGDKLGKAQAYQAMSAAGLVHLPEGDLGDEALKEYLSFPVGKHDDQVDADGAIARAVSDTIGAYVAPVPAQDYADDWDFEKRGFSEFRDLSWG